MTDESIRLSIIIVSWNVQGDLRNCLQSLLEGNAEVAAEVIVVDNASVDGTVAMLRSDFPTVHLVANADNRGFAAGNNQGLPLARGQWLLLLNPDTLVPAGGLEALLAFAAQHPEAGVIGPRLLNADGSLQHSCRRFPTIWAALFRHTFLGRLFPRAHWMQEYLMAEWCHDTPREVDWVSGACLLISRQAYTRVGQLDEGFYWGSEDVDYCYRVHQAGYQVLYTPEPAVTHLIGRSTDQVIVPTIIRTHRSMQRLYTKHLARNWFSRLLVTAGIWVRAGLLITSVWLRQHPLTLRRPR